jgi:hypothetical protein
MLPIHCLPLISTPTHEDRGTTSTYLSFRWCMYVLPSYCVHTISIQQRNNQPVVYLPAGCVVCSCSCMHYLLHYTYEDRRNQRSASYYRCMYCMHYLPPTNTQMDDAPTECMYPRCMWCMLHYIPSSSHGMIVWCIGMCSWSPSTNNRGQECTFLLVGTCSCSYYALPTNTTNRGTTNECILLLVVVHGIYWCPALYYIPSFPFLGMMDGCRCSWTLLHTSNQRSGRYFLLSGWYDVVMYVAYALPTCSYPSYTTA